MAYAGSDEIISAAENLADAFKRSDLYRTYRRSRLRVEEQPDLAYRLRAYKHAQNAYELKRLRDNSPPSFEEEKRISHLRAELYLNRDARAFLDCEETLLALYRKAAELLENACEIEVYGM